MPSERSLCLQPTLIDGQSVQGCRLLDDTVSGKVEKGNDVSRDWTGWSWWDDASSGPCAPTNCAPIAEIV